jgi:hypothetical protein
MTLDLNKLETSFDRIGRRPRSSASWLTSRLELGLLALWP